MTESNLEKAKLIKHQGKVISTPANRFLTCGHKNGRKSTIKFFLLRCYIGRVHFYYDLIANNDKFIYS